MQIDKNYVSFLNTIKSKILSARIQAYRGLNRELIRLYWDLGKTIVERQKQHSWGQNIVERLAKDLQHEFPNTAGFSDRNLCGKDGTLSAEMNYVDDKVDGVFKRYYKNGALLEETNFKLGIKQGNLKRYDEGGKLTQNDIYQNGQLLDENNRPFTGVKKEYYEGESWQENEYKDGKENGVSKTFKGEELMFERKFEDGKPVAYRTISKEMSGPQEWSSVPMPKNDNK